MVSGVVGDHGSTTIGKGHRGAVTPRPSELSAVGAVVGATATASWTEMLRDEHRNRTEGVEDGRKWKNIDLGEPAKVVWGAVFI